MDKADEARKIGVAISGVELALSALEELRPLHYGLGVDHTHRDPPRLDHTAECSVKHALVDLPMLVTALKAELAKRVDVAGK